MRNFDEENTAKKLWKYYKEYRTKDEFVSACLNTLLLGNKGTASIVWEVMDEREDWA